MPDRAESYDSIEKMPCSNCNSMMLPDTAKRNNGVCMSCKRKGKNQTTKKSSIIIPLVMGTLFLALGVGLFFYFDQCKELGKASTNWDSTSGVVTERFTRTAKRNTHGDSFSRNNQTTYYNIQYVYYVNGKKHTGDRIRIGSNNDCSSGDRQVGNKVTVHYDQKSPNNSVLIKGYAGENEQVWFWFRIAFLSMGIIGISRGLMVMLLGSSKNT